MMSKRSILLIGSLALLGLEGCGGGNGTTNYSIGGSVIGLTGSGLVLQNNSSDNISITSNGAFTFSNPAVNGTAYSVSIQTQPTDQTCTVAGDAGVVSSGNVTSIAVTCIANTYTIGGTVSGLIAPNPTGTGLVLENNGSNALTVKSSGSFAFATAVNSGANYSVSIETQPTNPYQTCTVTAASGTVATANVTSVAIACMPNQFTLGGTVSGLAGPGLILTDVNGDAVTVNANGSFVFPHPLNSGSALTVIANTEHVSPSQTCALTNDTGIIANANVTNVTVTCSTNSYTVGGTVSGLIGSGLVLVENGTTRLNASNGSFAFPAIPSGSSYSIAVQTQPSSPSQTCVPTLGSTGTGTTGTVGNANTSNLAFVCASSPGRFAFAAGATNGPSAPQFSSFVIDAISGSLNILTSVNLGLSLQGVTVSAAPSGQFIYLSSPGGIAIDAVDSNTGALNPAGSVTNGPVDGGTLAFNLSGTIAYFVSSEHINSYTVDPSTGALTANSLSPVAAGGSISVVLDPLGRFAYAVDTGAQSIYAYSVAPTTGALTVIPGSPFPGGTGPMTINPAGTIAYVPNATANNVAAYAIDSTTGALTTSTGSPFPAGGSASSVTLAPSANFAYVTAGTTLTVFSVSPSTGALSSLGTSSQVSTGSSPGPLVIHPSGKFAYLLNNDGTACTGIISSCAAVAEFSINTSTGALAPISGSPVSGVLDFGYNFAISN